jgi:hypothetical protein
MNLRLNWLIVLTFLILVGCQSPVAKNTSSDNETHGANGIGLTLKYYVGIFGDDQPTWRGQYYRKENLSIIAHLPTKSEFFIYTRRPEEENSSITNNLHLIVQKIREKSGATEAKDTWEKITQTVDVNKKGSRLVEFDYFRSEFVGTRADTDRYSKSDRVTTVIYAACLTPERPGAKAIYSVAIVMIPFDVPKTERERLLGVLSNFLREKITYLL